MTKQNAAARLFDANRAIGAVLLNVAQEDGVTRRRVVDESGSVGVRFSAQAGAVLSAVLVNTAGGAAGGDRFDIEIEAGAGSHLTASTAAAEKIYRSHGPDCVMRVKLRVAQGATLHWLPQETILFDQARLVRSIDVDMDAGGTLAMCEMMIFGRSAMGETFSHGHFRDQWRVRINGQLAFAENVRLDGDVAHILAHPACAGGAVAIATLLFAPGDEALLQRLRAVENLDGVEMVASQWNGIALLRMGSADAARLRCQVVRALSECLAAPPRLWLQ